MGGFGRKGSSSNSQSGSTRANPEELVRFDVTPHPLKMALGIALCLTAGLICLLMILQQRGLRIGRIIDLDPGMASIAFGLLVLASITGTIFCIRGLRDAFGKKVWLILDDRGITGPVTYNSATTTNIPFRQIADAKLSRMSKNEFMVIKSHGGQRIKVGSGNFRDEKQWPVFLAELQKRLV